MPLYEPGEAPEYEREDEERAEGKTPEEHNHSCAGSDSGEHDESNGSGG